MCALAESRFATIRVSEFWGVRVSSHSTLGLMLGDEIRSWSHIL